jgi:tRNA(Ile)-lysidine synthase
VAALVGMQRSEQRKNYTLIRPLLHLSKEELLAYLHKEKRDYFEDLTNSDEQYKRNEFRHNYANPLLLKYKEGIARSFEYLQRDKEQLIQEVVSKECNALFYFQSTESRNADIFHIDKYFKSIGKLLSAKERALLETQESLVIGRKFTVSFWKNYIFIAPFLQEIVMTKEFKEKMRKQKVPPKMRAYLSTDEEAVALLSLLFE